MASRKNPIEKTVSDPVLLDTNELERLRRDIYRPDMEKLRLFTQMLRANSLYKKVKVTHK